MLVVIHHRLDQRTSVDALAVAGRAKTPVIARWQSLVPVSIVKRSSTVHTRPEAVSELVVLTFANSKHHAFQVSSVTPRVA